MPGAAPKKPMTSENESDDGARPCDRCGETRRSWRGEPLDALASGSPAAFVRRIFGKVSMPAVGRRGRSGSRASVGRWGERAVGRPHGRMG